MEKIRVEVCNTSDNPLPKYGSEYASGMDLIAHVVTEDGNDRVQIVASGETALVHTGLYLAIPEGYEIQVRPRSGLALKLGITVLNSPGTIDSDYRGEVGVIIHNTHRSPFVIHNGDRIAQMVIKPTYRIVFDEVDSCDKLPDSDRGQGGFGSTGIK